MHFPDGKEDITNVFRRKKYVTYFNHSIQMEALSLLVLENNKEPKDGVKDKIIEFTNSLPYELTKSQKYAINQIVLDSKKHM